MSLDRATLLDIAKAQDPDGSIAQIAEILNQTNPMLQDAPVFPSNAQLAERVTYRSTLPVVQFAQINKGTIRSKGTLQQHTDTIGFIDGMSEVDIRLQKLVGPGAVKSHRAQEDDGFIEAMNQLMAYTQLYGDENTSPQAFTGLQPRLEVLGTAITGSQVVSMGSVGGGDTSSIYIVDWGRRGAHMIVPRDGDNPSGIEMKDHGVIRVNDNDNNPMMAAVTQFNWLLGLTVKDPRRIARLANIDRSDALLAAPTQGLIVSNLILMLNRMPSKMGFNRIMYTHRDILAAFQNQVQSKSNVFITMQEYLGEFIPHFHGIPMRSMDQMSASESTVS